MTLTRALDFLLTLAGYSKVERIDNKNYNKDGLSRADIFSENVIPPSAFQAFLDKYAEQMDEETYHIVRTPDPFDEATGRNFFRDKERRLDAVLVFEKEKLQSPAELAYISEYVRQLEYKGLVFEIEPSSSSSVIFIKTHIPKQTVDYFATKFNIELNNPGRLYLQDKTRIKCLLPNIAQYKTKLITTNTSSVSRERILIIFKLLAQVKFGIFDVYSVNRMIKEGFLKEAYPLHDGPYEWPDTGMYNSRQILAKYWATLRKWYLHQPLNLLKTYYGTQVSFYFAWLGFYNVMLIPASLFGFSCFLFGWFNSRTVATVTEVCKSELPMCPNCINGGHCKMPLLKDYCGQAHLEYIGNNYFACGYAMFISVWSVVFSVLWRRKEAILRLRWNADHTDLKTDEKTTFKLNTKYRRISPINNKYEAYVPFRIQAKKMIFTILSCTLMIGIIILVVIGVCVVRYLIAISVHKRGVEYRMLFSLILSALLQALCIKIFQYFCRQIASWLTEIENHRTQGEHDTSNLCKIYILNFFNYYSSLFYMAFFRGKFVTHPGKIFRHRYFYSDYCPPTGCLVEVGIYALILMILSSSIWNGFYLIISDIKSKFIQRKMSKYQKELVPQWETEYLLKSSHHIIVDYFLEKVIQYGFVTFFTAALPLASCVALISNIVGLRLEAKLLNEKHKRIVPNRVQGIRPWDRIIEFVTYTGMATNAMVIAFTTDFVEKQLYLQREGSMTGFVNYTLSEFAIEDLEPEIRNQPVVQNFNGSICYYLSYRNDPLHEKKYEYKASYWYIMSCQFIFLVIFEHAVAIIASTLNYTVPAVPLKVKQAVDRERILGKELINKYYTRDLKVDSAVNRISDPRRTTSVLHRNIHTWEL